MKRTSHINLKFCIGLAAAFLFGVIACIGTTLALASNAWAYSGEMPPEQQPPLPEGTVITTQNWEQYKDYMPDWMQWLFSGQYYFKVGPNDQIVVGPPTPKALPKAYVANTEKYSGQVKLKVLDDGGTLPENYVAGLPFPNPTEPHLGDKILWNVWYRYAPRLEQVDITQELLIDKNHQIFEQDITGLTQRLGHVSEPDEPIYNKDQANLDFAQYIEVLRPEQSKYTVSLTIFYTDPTREEDIWSFVPSLRRPLRLSSSSRCAPSLGTDLDIDDQKGGYNLQTADFNGHAIAHKKILVINNFQPAWPTHVDFTDPAISQLWHISSGVGWPPSSQRWELRDTYVVDTTRVPSKRTGYCYGNRRIYADSLDWTLSEDLYDMNMKPWKAIFLFNRLHPNGYGDTFLGDSSNYIFEAIDLQNSHLTFINEFMGEHVNHAADPSFYNVARYASPTGLLEIMK